MLRKIAAIAVGLVFLGGRELWAAPPADKGSAPTMQKGAASKAAGGQKNRVKSAGELRSRKIRECLKKHQMSIAQQTNGKGIDFRRSRKQMQEIQKRLKSADPELALLKQRRSALNASLAKPAAVKDTTILRELGDIEKKVHERETAINNHPELKPLTLKMHENSRKQLESLRSAVGQDKACSDLLLRPSHHSNSRKPLSGSEK